MRRWHREAYELLALVYLSQTEDRNSLKILDSHASPLDEPPVCAYTPRTSEGLLLAWALCLRHQVVQDDPETLSTLAMKIISIFYQTMMVLGEITAT